MTLVLACLLSASTGAQTQTPKASQNPPPTAPPSAHSPEKNNEPESSPTFDGTPIAKPTENSATPKQVDVLPAVKLGPGDLVEVSVSGVPELATKARISNEGELYLPLIDNVHVADLSLEEAQKVVEKRLEDGGFVRNPHVSIIADRNNRADWKPRGVGRDRRKLCVLLRLQFHSLNHLTLEGLSVLEQAPLKRTVHGEHPKTNS